MATYFPYGPDFIHSTNIYGVPTTCQNGPNFSQNFCILGELTFRASYASGNTVEFNQLGNASHERQCKHVPLQNVIPTNLGGALVGLFLKPTIKILLGIVGSH